MGMYDIVEFSAPCFKCPEILTDWQSKDGPCDLQTLQPYEVKRMYTKCPRCKSWNEYEIVLVPPKPPYFLIPRHRVHGGG